MALYKKPNDKKSGDGLALTEWNDLSSAVAGNAGLTLAISPDDKVGIGISTPLAKLHVINADTDANGHMLTLGPVNGSHLRLGYHKDYSWIQSHGSKPLRINPLGNDLIIGDINVGIGSDKPTEKLDVKGKVKATHFIGDGSQLTNLSMGATGLNLATTANSKVGIGTTNPTAKLDIDAGGGSNIGLKVNGRMQSIGAGGLWVDEGMKKFVGEVGDGIGFWNTAWHLSVGSNGNVGIGTNAPIAKLQVVGGAIMPAEGSGEAAGILFKPDAFGGSGDRAYIRYYARSGESTTLEIGNLNDSDDHIALMPGGSVGIGTTAPAAKLHVEGAIMEKMDVIRCGGRGDWTAQNHPIMRYFKEKLAGKPVGTYIKAIQDHTSWRGHYWQGWVDVDGKIRVIHNQINTTRVVT